MFFLPVALFFLLFYFILLGGLFFILKIGLMTIAFEKIGITPEGLFLLLVVSLFGSLINIPVKKVASKDMQTEQEVRFFGWCFRVPLARHGNETIIAINLGGAVLPTALCLYLVARWPAFVPSDLISVVAMSFIIHGLARSIRGVGIATPALLPPLIAAVLLASL